jgi:hypothetical protein
MASKIAAFVITLIISLAIGAVIFFMMLIAMNGYSGGDAEWGLIAYIALAVVTSLLSALGALLLARTLIKRKFSPLASVLIAAPVFAVIAAILDIVSCLIGIGIAEYVRVNY